MTSQIDPGKLAQLDKITLDKGRHDSFDEGANAMEVVAWLADEGHTDSPECVSPLVRRYTIVLSDSWDDEKRQALKPYLVRMIDTGSDGKEDARREILCREVAALASPWLRLAELGETADRLDDATTDAELRSGLDESSSQALNEHIAQRRKLAERIEAELKKRGLPDVVTDVVTDAMTDGVTDAAANAVAAAVASAISNAVAVVATDAAVDAAVLADAAAVVGSKQIEVYSEQWRAIREAAYKIARDEMMRQIDTADALADFRTLRDEQDGAALRILDALLSL